MKKALLSMLFLLTIGTNVNAQETPAPDTLTESVSMILGDLEKLKRIKISGYMQPQFQWADSSGQNSVVGGNFAPNVDKRFMLRRSRVKIEYLGTLSQFVFNVDVTERGVTIKDCFAKVTEPWLQTVSLTAGMMLRPFGYEIFYSSALRESPERGRMSQILFPGERDLGAMITIQAPKTSKWNMIKFEAGMYNGTGAPSQGANTSDFDFQKDLITRLTLNKNSRSEKVKFGLGVSYYDGGFRQSTNNVYTIASDSLGVTGYIRDNDTLNNGAIAKRNYIGADAQVSLIWIAGITTFRAEYILGQQPGSTSTSTSPSAQPTTDTYIRNFSGAYFYFTQNIMQTKHQLVVKYDWYDPNTDVAGDEIGLSVTEPTGETFAKTNRQDIRWDNIGIGWIYYWDTNVKLMAFYDMQTNETSQKLSGFTKDIKDNVFTLRLQYKF